MSKTYEIKFSGYVRIDAESASEASDIFNGEFGGEEILDAISEQEIYSTDAKGYPVKRCTWIPNTGTYQE